MPCTRCLALSQRLPIALMHVEVPPQATAPRLKRLCARWPQWLLVETAPLQLRGNCSRPMSRHLCTIVMAPFCWNQCTDGHAAAVSARPSRGGHSSEMNGGTLQAQLNINQGLIQGIVADRAASQLPRAAAIDDDPAAWAAMMDVECPALLTQCPHTDLNPFPNGFIVTMAFGRYLKVQPVALESYYTKNFLLEMTECVTNDDSCGDAVPAELQVRCGCGCSPLLALSMATWGWTSPAGFLCTWYTASLWIYGVIEFALRRGGVASS